MTLAEAGSPMQSLLQAGLDQLDLSQVITFQGYQRVVLPVDGYVFWSPSVPLTISGSLHYSQDIVQTEDETFGNATVTLTTSDQVVQFAEAPTSTIYVATIGNFRYAFSSQGGFYNPAGLWHYMGHSVQPAMAAMLLDSPDAIDFTRAVTSNSLALWLSLNNYVCPYYDGFSNALTLYPSYLTPPNILPAYGAVHIDPNLTRALQAVPYLDRNRRHTQLLTDHVRITIYGLQSDEAIDFVDTVMQFSRDTDAFGIMNMPVITDGKRVQNELETIAMQKIVEFDVSYYQTRVANVARQLILSAVPTYLIDTTPAVATQMPLSTQDNRDIATQAGQDLTPQ